MHRIIPVLVLGLSMMAAYGGLASSLAEAADRSGAADSPSLQTTPTPIPTSSSSEGPEPRVPTGPPLPLTLTLLGLCCAFLILIGVVVLGFVVRRENRQPVKDE